LIYRYEGASLMAIDVAVIGVGKVGIRHFQALLKCKNRLKIHIVDPDKNALKAARDLAEKETQICGQMPHDLAYLSEITELPLEITICIVSTNSDIRAMIVAKLLDFNSMKYLILEKVLFQKLADYDEIGERLEKQSIEAWVNCPMRLIQPYTNIPSELDYSKPITISVTGVNWGLACNSVHFIDFFRFLTRQPLKFLETRLSSLVSVSNNRGVFFEFYGEIHGAALESANLKLECSKNDKVPTKIFSIEIENGCKFKKQYVFRPGAISCHNLNDPNKPIISFPETYQSNLTNIVIDKIIDKGACELPTYKASAADHILLLENILRNFRNHPDFSSGSCPIT
jgi:hypothetical protein